MTAKEFRETPELLAWMRGLVEHQNFKLALEAMRSLHPVRRVAPSDVTPHGAHILLGEQTGWQQYEQEFLKLGQPVPRRDPLPEPTYPRDEEEHAAEES